MHEITEPVIRSSNREHSNDERDCQACADGKPGHPPPTPRVELERIQFEFTVLSCSERPVDLEQADFRRWAEIIGKSMSSHFDASHEVPHEEFSRDPGAIMARARDEGPIVVLGEDGEPLMRISFPEPPPDFEP